MLFPSNAGRGIPNHIPRETDPFWEIASRGSKMALETPQNRLFETATSEIPKNTLYPHTQIPKFKPIWIFYEFWLLSTSNKVISLMYLSYGYLAGIMGFPYLFYEIRNEFSYSIYHFLFEIANIQFDYDTSWYYYDIPFIMPTLIGGIGNREIPELSALSDFILPRLNTISFGYLLLQLFCPRCNEQGRITGNRLNSLPSSFGQGISLLNGSYWCDHCVTCIRIKFRRRCNEFHYHSICCWNDCLVLNLSPSVKYGHYFSIIAGIITTISWRNYPTPPRSRDAYDGIESFLRRWSCYFQHLFDISGILRYILLYFPHSVWYPTLSPLAIPQFWLPRNDFAQISIGIVGFVYEHTICSLSEWALRPEPISHARQWLLQFLPQWRFFLIGLNAEYKAFDSVILTVQCFWLCFDRGVNRTYLSKFRIGPLISRHLLRSGSLPLRTVARSSFGAVLYQVFPLDPFWGYSFRINLYDSVVNPFSGANIVFSSNTLWAFKASLGEFYLPWELLIPQPPLQHRYFMIILR